MASVLAGDPSHYRHRSPSTTHHSWCRDARNVVVCHVVKEVSGTPPPQLTHSIYEDWSLLMRIKLEVRDLRDAVQHGGANRLEDHMALRRHCLYCTARDDSATSGEEDDKRGVEVDQIHLRRPYKEVDAVV
jgi:hypothetical protein